MTPENIPAPFKTRSSGGTPDIDLLAQTMQKRNENYSNDNPFILDLESDAFSPPAPSFFDKDDIDKDNKTLPRPCRVPKPKQS